MSAKGWICFHRKMLEWEWYDDINTCRLFIHILLSASHKDSKYRGEIIPKGSLKTGRILLSEQTGLSIQQVRTSLTKLKSTNEITIKTTTKYSIISIANWETYQDNNQQNNQRVTNEQPTSNQRVTTFNNVNNETMETSLKENTKEKKKRTVFLNPSKTDVIEFSVLEKLNLNGFFDYYESNGWMVGKNKMKDWKAAARGWSGRQQNFPKNTSSNNSANNLLDEGTGYVPQSERGNRNDVVIDSTAKVINT